MSALQPSDPKLPQRHGCVTATLVLLGVILLLPGLCAAITAVVTVPSLLIGLWEDSLPNASWPFFGLWVAFWVICFLVSYAGVKLLRSIR